MSKRQSLSKPVKDKVKKRKANTLSLKQINALFPNDETATAFIEEVIWDGTPICPHCGSDKSYRIKRIKGYRCSKCRKNFTFKIGTIFENSHVPMNDWISAMYMMVTGRMGTSSMEIGIEIETCQKTAWFLLHRLREACKLSPVKLCDIVEVDETHIGGKEKNKHSKKKLGVGGGAGGKQIVVGARGRNGVVTAQVVSDKQSETMHNFVINNVAEGALLMTDEGRWYLGLDKIYDHNTVNHSIGEFAKLMRRAEKEIKAHTNGIESVWAIMKRTYEGVYFKMSPQHLQNYVNEVVFRLNQGNCAVDTIDRIKALIRCAVGKRLTYKELIAKKDDCVPLSPETAEDRRKKREELAIANGKKLRAETDDARKASMPGIVKTAIKRTINRAKHITKHMTSKTRGKMPFIRKHKTTDG